MFTPNQVQRFHTRISALLHWKNLVDTFRMYPVNLFKSRSQHEIFGQIPTVDIIPETSSFFQDLVILKRDFWNWAWNLLNWSFSLSCFRSVFRIVAISFGRNMFNNVVCISGFIHFLSQTSCACSSMYLSKAILILQLFVKKPVVFRTYSLDSDRIF